MIPAEHRRPAFPRLAMAAQQHRRVDLEFMFPTRRDVGGLYYRLDAAIASEQQPARLAWVFAARVVAYLFGSRAENFEAHAYIG